MNDLILRLKIGQLEEATLRMVDRKQIKKKAKQEFRKGKSFSRIKREMTLACYRGKLFDYFESTR